MKVNKLTTVLVNVAVSLAFIFTFFISSPLWADEKSSFDEQLAHADNIRSSQPKLFLVLINELNQHTNNLSNSQQHYLDYLNLYLLMYQGNFTEAIASSKTLLSTNADTLLKFRAKLGLVNIFALNQNWSEGLSTLSKILTELPLIQDKKTYHNGLLVTALFYNHLGQYNLSLSYAKQVELSSSQGRDNCLAKSYIIESSFKLKQLTPSDPKIQHAISLCRINKEHLYISLINSYVARIYIDNQQQDKALELLSSTLQNALNSKYTHIIAEYYSLLAQGHWLNNNTDLTKQFALQALKHENIESTILAKVLSYKILFEVFQTEGNHELALLYHQKYAIADKLYYDETQAKHIAFQVAEHQSIEQENRISLLHEKNALLSSEKALLTAEQALVKANAENTRFIMIILLMTLTVLIFWGVRLLKAHKRIKQLAEYDSLTRVFNRGHFTQVANNAISYCKNAEQEVSIIVFDLDNFKSVNDNYGHACGDWALKKSVEVCKTIGRQNDIFSRLGGEEFCLLLTSCNNQAAQLRAEACRKAIAEINTAESGFEFTFTASFGVTDAKTSGYDLEKLLADADSAAYTSKHAGRNQVTVFQAEQTDGSSKGKPLDNSWDIMS